MNIRSLKLNPFAGTQKREVSFQKGLNIILGANEAGKSTLIKALRCLFFVSPGLSPKKLETEISPFMPILGGDTIRVSAEIDLNGETYNIEKEFGEIKRAKMIFPSKAELNNITQIDAELIKMLGFSRATYEQVLITHQTDLARTIEKLKNTEGAETRSTLSNKLRSVLIELDGVPADKLKEEAEKLYANYFDNWDDEKNIPRDGKDINNPHKRSLGEILKAYYAMRQLEADIEEVEKYEKALDELNIELNSVSDDLKNLLDYKQNFEPVYTDAQKRHAIESNLKVASNEKNNLADVGEKWPVTHNKWFEARTFLEQKSAEVLTLEKHVKEWKDHNRLQQLRNVFDKANELAEQYKLEAEALKLLPQVSETHIRDAKKMLQEIEKLKNIVDAQKLKIAIRAKKDVHFTVRKGISATEEISITEGEIIQQEAGGRIQFDNEDFTIVVSAAGDVKKTLEQIELKETELKDFLGKWNVAHIEALEKMLREKELAEMQLKSRSEEIKRLLNGQKLADMEAQLKSVKKPGTHESQEALEERLKQLQNQLSENRATENFCKKQLNEWEQKYGSKENLLEKLLENKSQLTQLEKQLKQLKPLPENYKNTEDFLNDFRQKSKKLEDVKDLTASIKQQIAELKAPNDFSTEELLEKLEAAKTNFESTHKIGLAYKKVLAEINAILDDFNKETFTPLKEKTEFYFNKLTGGKYGSLRLDETVPDAVELNGKFLPSELLSTGTLDLLALATRLAMADFYLEDNKGFIVLDDPLVNLDPARQKLAAECLQEISEKRQLIILTCHPQHAQLLQGNIIEL